MRVFAIGCRAEFPGFWTGGGRLMRTPKSGERVCERDPFCSRAERGYAFLWVPARVQPVNWPCDKPWGGDYRL